MMFCANCGKPIQAEQTVCAGCGASIQKPIKKENKGWLIASTVVGVILLLFVAFLLLLAYTPLGYAFFSDSVVVLSTMIRATL